MAVRAPARGAVPGPVRLLARLSQATSVKLSLRVRCAVHFTFQGRGGVLNCCPRHTQGKKRSLASSHAFGSSGLSQEVRIAGSAKRTVPNDRVPLSSL